MLGAMVYISGGASSQFGVCVHARVCVSNFDCLVHIVGAEGLGKGSWTNQLAWCNSVLLDKVWSVYSKSVRPFHTTPCGCCFAELERRQSLCRRPYCPHMYCFSSSSSTVMPAAGHCTELRQIPPCYSGERVAMNVQSSLLWVLQYQYLCVLLLGR